MVALRCFAVGSVLILTSLFLFLNAQSPISEFEDTFPALPGAVKTSAYNDSIIVTGFRLQFNQSPGRSGFTLSQDSSISGFKFQNIPDIFDANGHDVKDSLVYTAMTPFSFAHSVLSKINFRGETIDTAHIPPPGAPFDYIQSYALHAGPNYLYLSGFIGDTSTFGTLNPTTASCIYKLDYDFNVIDYNIYYPENSSLFITDITGKEDSLLAIFIYDDIVTTSNKGKSVVSIASDWSLDTLFTNRTSRVERKSSPAQHIYRFSESLILFELPGLISERFYDGEGILYCINESGELLWEYTNHTQQPYEVDDRRYNVGEIRKVGDQLIISGTAGRNRGYDEFQNVPYMTSLSLDGEHNWTRLYYYYRTPFLHDIYSGDYENSRPPWTTFNSFAVKEDGTFYAVGVGFDLPNLDENGSVIDRSHKLILAEFDSVGCPYPNCETEVFIGATPVPNTNVIPGRRWSEREWSTGDTLVHHYRFGRDSFFTAGRYYVPVEKFDFASGDYQPTGKAMREIMGKTFLRENDFDHLINNKLYGVDDQMNSVVSFPGNVPFLPVQQRILVKDSIVTDDGKTRLRLIYDCPQFNNPVVQTYTWVDGVGRLEGRFSIFNACGGVPTSELLCVRDWDQIIYTKEGYLDCDILDDVSNPDSANQLSVFPNPTSGWINVQGTPVNALIEVYDEIGRLILTTKATTFDLSDSPKGAYVISVTAADKYWVRKVIVK